MSTNFPTGLDTYTAKTDNVDTVQAATINALQDAVAALEAKVGQDGSAITSTLDYRVAHAAGGGANADIAASLGVATAPRSSASGAALSAFSAGFPYFTGFVPQVSFTAANVTVYQTATTTPTHAYVGLYSVSALGALTLIAVSADTVSLGTTGKRKVAMTTPVALTAGGAYAVAVLLVGATMSFATAGSGTFSATVAAIGSMTIQPFMSGYLTAGAATVLPASVAFAAVTVYNPPVYAEITV